MMIPINKQNKLLIVIQCNNNKKIEEIMFYSPKKDIEKYVSIKNQ